jgi:hypothetical protein
MSRCVVLVAQHSTVDHVGREPVHFTETVQSERIARQSPLAILACAPGRAESIEPGRRAGDCQVDSLDIAAWLRDDTAAVLRTLALDAVPMPAGRRPLATPNDIRRSGGPATAHENPDVPPRHRRDRP